MSLPDLAAVLWRQRELIERLCYRLECEQLLLANGRMTRVALAVEEVQSCVQDLSVLELQRAEAAERAATELGLPAGTGLTDLAAAGPPPGPGGLLAHRAALLALTLELRALADSNKQLVAGGVAALEAAINSLGLVAAPASVGYDAHGHSSSPIAGRMPALVDRVL